MPSTVCCGNPRNHSKHDTLKTSLRTFQKPRRSVSRLYSAKSWFVQNRTKHQTSCLEHERFHYVYIGRVTDSNLAQGTEYRDWKWEESWFSQPSQTNIRIILQIAARSRVSAVGIATGYGLDDRGVGFEPWWGLEFSSRRPGRPWRPPSLISNGFRWLFPRG
jgi:hypothetical protein